MASCVRVRPISRRIIVLAPLLLCLFIRLQLRIAIDSGLQVAVFPFNSVPFFVLNTHSALLQASKSSHRNHSLLLISSQRPSSVLLILLLSGDIETNPGPNDDPPAAAVNPIPSKHQVCVHT